MTQTSQELITDYLNRLRAACWPLGDTRTAELVDGIAEHIHDACLELGDNPSTVVGVLERLGSPERIAQEASEQPPAAQTPLLVEKPSLTHEIWTVALLTVGGFVLPFLAWVAGVILLIIGKRWVWWEKLVGVAIVPGGPLGGLILLGIGQSTHKASASSCVVTDSGKTCTLSGQAHVWSGFAVIALLASLLGPLAVGTFLWFRAKHRAALERPRLVPFTYGTP